MGNSAVHFFYHLEHYLDADAAAANEDGAVKVARALSQAAARARKIRFCIANDEEKAKIDIFDSNANYHDEKVSARYYAANLICLEKLLHILIVPLAVSAKYESGDKELLSHYKGLLTFVGFANKVIARTAKLKKA
jgi:hypothetical protein